MFVFMGAFQDVRNKKQARENALSELEYCMYGKEKDNRNDALYTDININEIVEYGMIEELAGRISQVVNLHRLSDKDMGVLLKEKTQIAEGFLCQTKERARSLLNVGEELAL